MGMIRVGGLARISYPEDKTIHNQILLITRKDSILGYKAKFLAPVGRFNINTEYGISESHLLPICDTEEFE